MRTTTQIDGRTQHNLVPINGCVLDLDAMVDMLFFSESPLFVKDDSPTRKEMVANYNKNSISARLTRNEGILDAEPVQNTFMVIVWAMGRGRPNNLGVMAVLSDNEFDWVWGRVHELIALRDKAAKTP